MRKKIVAILLAATMAIGITACGNQSESNKDDNTITVWCWDKTFNIFAMECMYVWDTVPGSWLRV